MNYELVGWDGVAFKESLKGARTVASTAELIAGLENYCESAIVMGAGTFTYDASLYTINNGVDIINGWVLQSKTDKANIASNSTRIASLEVAQSAGLIGFMTKADMDADLAHNEGTIAKVTNDATPSNNGEYIKQLASGSGSWSPSSFDRVAVLEEDVSYVNDKTLYSYLPSENRTIDVLLGTYQRSVLNITNPDTRYDVQINTTGAVVDLINPSVLLAGLRINSVERFPSRTYSVDGYFYPGGYALDSNSGIGIAFDDSSSSGANTTWGQNAIAWIWRANGSVTSYNLYSSTYDAAYKFTLISGAISSFMPGDMLKLKLIEAIDGKSGILKGFKNGVLEFTGEVSAIPKGKLSLVARGIGGGGAYPSALRFVFTNISIIDLDLHAIYDKETVTNEIANILINSSITERLTALSSLSYVDDNADFNGHLKRNTPPGLEWVYVKPLVVNGYGRVKTSSIISALFDNYPKLINSDIAYVSTNGVDAVAIVGDAKKPFLTIDAALQSSAYIIVVGDGVFTPPDYRYTQAAAGEMKLIVSSNKGKTILSNGGDDIGTNTWTQTTGYTNIYETTISSAIGSTAWNSARPHNIRLIDTLGEYSYKKNVNEYVPSTQDANGVAATLLLLEQSTAGWVYDGINKKLYVSLGGEDLSINRNRLDAIYTDANGSDRVLMNGANLAFNGIHFDGQLLWASEYNNNGVYVPSSTWCMDCIHTDSIAYGVQGDSNTTIVLDNSIIHNASADGINTDSTRNGSGALAKALLINTTITNSGCVDKNGTTISSNRQAISSHAGHIVSFGGIYEHNWGQEIADTGLGNGESISWYVGSVAKNGDSRLTPNNVGFGFYDANRIAWLDTCASMNEGTSPLAIEGGASVKTFNCQFDSSETVISPSTASTLYTPDAP